MSKRSQDMLLEFLGVLSNCAKLKGAIKGNVTLFPEANNR
jgi:hypothetical protein